MASRSTTPLPKLTVFLTLLLTACPSCQKPSASTDAEIIDEAIQESQKGNHERAIEMFSAFLTDHPDNLKTLRARGGAYIAAGDIDRALEDLNRAVAIDPNDGVTRNNRAIVWKLMNRSQEAIEEYEKAIEDFTKAIELTPDDYGPYALRYNAYVYLGDLEKARIDGRKAHQLNPEWSMPGVNNESSANESSEN